MKKTTKRIVCGALSLMMVSSLALERAIRYDADGETQSTVLADASFQDVTGKFDTQALMESNFNASVLKNTEPRYETRSVIVTLSKDNLVQRAEGDVNEYLSSWQGERAKAEIQKQQDDFLKALSGTGISYTLERRYNTVINAVAVELNTKHVSYLKSMKGVESVVITSAFSEPKTVDGGAFGGLPENETSVYKTGIYDSNVEVDKHAYGAGTVVAVLDTGLDYTHNAFQTFMSNVDESLLWSESDIAEKLASAELAAETRTNGLEASDVYVSSKVPYAYDYADDDPDVYPSYSNHGTHVAGIIGGYDENGYTDKDGNPVAETFYGVAPDAQLAIFKVFTDDLNDPELGGAVPEDIIAALEDCVKLNVDVINMSLGTSCGFSTTDDGDSEGEMLNAVYENIQKAGISLVCAASNDYSSAYGGVYGTNLSYNPDSSTVGSPSTFAAALSVASINGQQANYMIANEGKENQSYVFYEESRDIDGNPFDFAKDLTAAYPSKNGEFEYVVIPGIGQVADYSGSIKSLLKSNGKSTGRIALIKRGDSTFEEKVRIAMDMGAAGVIVYNNVAGVIRMNLGEIENPVPAVSISLNAGNALISAAVNRVGKIKIDPDNTAGPFMSEFSSWGPTHDLKLKPEITAHGGEITSTVPGGYGEQSGTSMASPNMAGVVALVRNYIEKEHPDLFDDTVGLNRLAMQLLMSTAESAKDPDGKPYSPRKQGAGLASLSDAIASSAYLWTDVAENDNRPKIELGDDPEKSGVYELNFKITNFGASELAFTSDYEFMTETLSADGKTVNEQAYMLNDKSSAVWSVSGNGRIDGDTIKVSAGGTATVSVTLTMNDNAKAYIDNSFENGMYVEGFLKLLSKTNEQSDLSIPFLGFFGDWESSPMLDYTAYEVAADAKDASIKDEDKIKASVWATQPFTSYYNEKYIIPMGGYVHLLDEDDEPMYTDEAKSAVSRYNTYYGEGVAENYMSTTGIKAVYAGLLRNARVVKYKMYDTATGECLIPDGVINRVGKAYSGGGSAVPGNVELELSPEERELVANGTYRMEFEFYMNDPETHTVFEDDPATVAIEDVNNAMDTFEFSFTVDYEAPVLQSARVRYYNYKDGKKDKQRIYLDMDVYDNHYAQSLMLCYPKMDETGQLTLQLSTDYPTPVRNAVKNGVTRVTVEITDIYEKYGNQLYVQLDDYALNTCLYQLNIAEANANMLPDGADFGLADGEEELTLDIYGSHKVSLVYGEEYSSEADPSNFIWTSKNPTVAGVKNGEIVGFKAGTTEIVVGNGKGYSKTIQVTVTNKKASLVNVPGVSFGVIKNENDALQKAAGSVKVKAGREFTLSVETDPWYHPLTGITFKWASTNPQVASVDQNGLVKTLKKGVATITAVVVKDGKETLYAASVMLSVQNEFTASNYQLNDYNGVGYNAWECPACHEIWVESELISVEKDGKMNLYCCPDCNKSGSISVCEKADESILKIPSNMNIMQIAMEAFKDNRNIKKLIIPSSVTEIGERAFLNCTALEEICFVSPNYREDGNGNVINANVDWADLSIIHESAFEGCTSLKKIDFTNVKTITVANRAFADCKALTEIIDLKSVGTMGDQAFSGCTALKGEKLDGDSEYILDLSGLHVCWSNVFENCTSIEQIKTGKFTALGKNMFKGCSSLGANGIIEIKTPNIGEAAFAGCTNMRRVKLVADSDDLKFSIGARAFERCGADVRGNFIFNFNHVKIRSIGDEAFKNSKLTQLTNLDLSALEEWGGKIFQGANVTEIELNDGFDFTKLRVLGVPFKGINVSVGNSTKYVIHNNVVYYKLNGNDLMAVYAQPTWMGAIHTDTTVIGAYAFAETGVVHTKIPAGVVSIGEGAFQNSKATQISFQGNALVEIADRAFYGAECTFLQLPSSVKKIGDYAFANSYIQTLDASNVTEIGNYAFANCSLLQKITNGSGTAGLSLSHSVTLGEYAFSGCINLESVSIKTEKVGVAAFAETSGLKSVTFLDGSKEIGEYAFFGSSVENVTLADAITEIPYGAFYRCNRLETVDLGGIQTVSDFAFAECSALKTVNGLDDVVTIGDYAFYGAKLVGGLTLTAAERVGDYAFASQSGTSDYTSIELPRILEIGHFAFLGGKQESVTLPVTVEKIGNGAFATSENLTEFTVAEGNENFFVKDGVLFRYITDDTYTLVSYPTARTQEKDENGKKVYVIPDGTVGVQAYAFYDLNEKGLDEVVLSHSVNTIGDSAFLDSGVKEYTFKSIQAPVLETVYRQEIEDAIESMSIVAYYKGYYYANFQTYLFNFTHYVGEKSDLVMNYPANGKGYDNHIYSLYFGEKNVKAVEMTDETRELFALYESLSQEKETISALLNQSTFTETEKATITAFAEKVQSANILFSEALANAQQSAFVSEEVRSAMESIGQLNRSLKAKIGVKTYVTKLKVDGNSSYKKEYKPGETFDKTGLVVSVVYDDYSEKRISWTEMQLVTSGALTENTKYILIRYTGKEAQPAKKIEVNVEVTVKAETSEENKNPVGGNDSVSKENGENSVNMALVGIAVGVLIVCAVIAVIGFNRSYQKKCKAGKPMDQYKGELRAQSTISKKASVVKAELVNKKSKK